VLQLAQDLIDRFGGLPALLRADAAAMRGVKGLGPARRAELQAVLELARRSLRAELVERPVFDAPAAVRDHLRLQLLHLRHEVFMVMFLDTQLRLLASEALFRGTVNQASVYPREVVQRALALNATAVILAHNHPSGVAEPSRADEHLTRAIQSALALVDVRVLDHLVVAQGGTISFAERGLL
jgi:DNA repair protein RadC